MILERKLLLLCLHWDYTSLPLYTQEQAELLDLLEQQHQVEREELNQKLKLEQDEETEKLRKVRCWREDWVKSDF